MVYILIGIVASVWLYFHSFLTYPLLEATQKGDTFRVRELLNRGIKIHKKDAKRNTALIHAARLGHLEIVHLLVEKGAHINVENNDADTPLIMAARNGHAAVVELLLERGAVIKKHLNQDRTALTELIWSKDVETLQVFLNQGISFQNSNYHREFCEMLERACILNDYPMIRVLLENAPNLKEINCFDEHLLTQFYDEWNFELLKLSLEKGANPNVFNPTMNETLLYQAYADQRMEVFSLLIQHGANLNNTNYQDNS